MALNFPQIFMTIKISIYECPIVDFSFNGVGYLTFIRGLMMLYIFRCFCEIHTHTHTQGVCAEPMGGVTLITRLRVIHVVYLVMVVL